ncbi:MAG: class I SAM-dependent methyltransferase [Rhodoferax sp.]|nr:class I SAM-dependent methyltransferase [Rhodoferax sp.]
MVLLLNPSPWIVRWSHLLEPHATVLDIACGSGRHLAWFAARHHAVTGIDRDTNQARLQAPSAELLCADIENNPWPFQTDGVLRTFGAVVVTNYLWRPLLETVVNSVAPGGVLLYETFAAGNETLGRPSRPDFLLQPGELLQACAGLEVVAYENGTLQDPPRVVQRIAAVRAPADHRRLPEIWRLAL